jgi:tetratricopeptide (TPR) repeat protein/tRNA A-37 threonylcarbamoyl transferase component Bud32
MRGCLTTNELYDLLEGPTVASGVVDDDAREHLQHCGLCRDVLSDMQRLYDSGALAAVTRELLAPGTNIARYRVLDVIGSGAMGTVYAVYDPVLDRRVALKLVRGRVVSDETRERVLREAQAMARLAHPNVIAVHDAGIFGEEVFIAMELVEGRNLSRWLAETAPTLPAILDVFMQAGRGLSAAHRAGLVHRDFKPDNVLVGNDGLVRVGDFGLARIEGASTAPASTEKSASLSLTRTLTRTGMLLGTPAYMPLEQLEGRWADARSDQFAFCVALYQAVYGERPYHADTLVGLTAAVAAGNVRPAPRGTRVPARLREVLLRGLAASPDDRFASIDALLTALARDPQKTRLAWAGAALLSLFVVAGVVVAQRARRAEVCGGAVAKLFGVWDDGRRRAVHDAFSATHAPFAEAAFATTVAQLDRYVASWSAMHGEACRATRVRGEQSEEVMELRMECLDRRREELRALVDLFDQANATMIERAPQASQSLASLDECTHADALRQVVRPPSATVRQRVEALRPQLAKTEAKLRTGNYAEGLTLAEATAKEARALGYAPLTAEALQWLGDLQQRRGDPNVAITTLLAAVNAAESGHADLTRARALNVLAWIFAERLPRYSEAHDTAALARAALARAGGDPLLEAAIDTNEGSALDNEGRYAEALAQGRRVLARQQQLLGSDDMRLGPTYHNLGQVQYQLGQFVEATADHRRALAIFERSLGPQHPWTALALNGLGMDLFRTGDVSGAVEAYQRALTIRETALGPDHPEVAATLDNLGEAFMRLHEYEKAQTTLERAATIVRRQAPNGSPSLGNYESSLAELFLSMNKLDEAEAHARRSLAIREHLLDAEHPDLADSLVWLGRVRLARHDPQAALPLFERAITIFEHHPADPQSLAQSRFGLAQALWLTGGDRARARQLAVAARDHVAVDERTTVANWLATRSAAR